MNASIIQATLQKTLNGQITFPQVVGTLLAEGVESYHVDLVRHEYRYYHSSGENFVDTVDLGYNKAQMQFSADGVKAAIKASQAGEIKYKEFMDRILNAGCVFYVAYLSGKKVSYFGRNGEVHVENFPTVK